MGCKIAHIDTKLLKKDRLLLFLQSPFWRLGEIASDPTALLLEATVGKRYGTHIMGFAQKPRDDV